MRGSPAVPTLIVIASLLSAPIRVVSEERSSAAPSSRAVEAIRLLDSDDPFQRQLGFLRLEALRGPRTAETIRKNLASKDPETRGYSLRALAAIEGTLAIPVLEHALSTEKTPGVRRSALLGLEPFAQSDPTVLPVFLKGLHDRSPEVRMAAVDVVSRIDDPRAREAILRRNRVERHRDVRRVLGLAMKRLGS